MLPTRMDLDTLTRHLSCRCLRCPLQSEDPAMLAAAYKASCAQELDAEEQRLYERYLFIKRLHKALRAARDHVRSGS